MSVSTSSSSITSTPPPILGVPSRCVIYCSTARFSEYPDDWQRSLVRSLVESAGGDYSFVNVLGIIKGRKNVFVVFDYNNPQHISTCKVLGFRVKQARAFKLIAMPADYIHSTVSRWLEENKRWGISFPREGEVRQSKGTKPAPSPPSTLTISKFAKDDTPKNEQGSFISSSYSEERKSSGGKG